MDTSAKAFQSNIAYNGDLNHVPKRIDSLNQMPQIEISRGATVGQKSGRIPPAANLVKQTLPSNGCIKTNAERSSRIRKIIQGDNNNFDEENTIPLHLMTAPSDLCHENTNSKLLADIPKVTVTEEFEFIDDINNVSQVPVILPKDSESKTSKAPESILNVDIPGDFDFIDDTNKGSSVPKETVFSHFPIKTRVECSKDIPSNNISRKLSVNKKDTSVKSETILSNPQEKLLKYSRDIIPSIIIKGDFCFIDDPNASSDRRESLPSSSSTKENVNCSDAAALIKSLNESQITDEKHSQLQTDQLPSTSSTMVNFRHSRETPPAIIPGDFKFVNGADRKVLPCNPISDNSSNIHNNKSLDNLKSLNNAVSPKANRNETSPRRSSESRSQQMRDIPSVVIPGDFEFIDDINAASLTYREVFFDNYDKSQSKMNKCDSSNLPSPSSSSAVIFKIPSIYLPTNLQFIDDTDIEPHSKHKSIQRGDKTHSSLKIPRRHSTKRNLCRHHSDSEAKASSEASDPKRRHHRSRSRRIKRSVSAVEANKDGHKTRVRRSLSDRSGMAGNRLRPPSFRSRPHSHYENGSSRCSSTRTLSTNVSISEIVAVEMGIKDIPGLTPKEARRKRMVCTVVTISAAILAVCVLLVAVTLLLSPEIDALCKLLFLIFETNFTLLSCIFFPSFFISLTRYHIKRLTLGFVALNYSIRQYIIFS